MGHPKKQTDVAKRPLGIAIAIGNQKGGVAKSTTAIHLAAALGKLGYRCLVWDLDPTAGATTSLGVDPESYEGTLELIEGVDPLELIVEENLPEGVHLIASREELCELPDRLRRKNTGQLLRAPLEVLRTRYDYIILDTPPNPSDILTIGSYMAAEWVILSCTPEHKAPHGLNGSLASIGRIRIKSNKQLEVLGVCLSRFKRNTNIAKQTLEDINRLFPGRAFHTSLRESVAVQNVGETGRTLFDDRKYRSHPLAREYLQLAREVEHRTQNRERFLKGRLRPSLALKAI